MTAPNEEGLPGRNREAQELHAPETSLPASWRDHHGSPCSCGDDPVRGERLSEVMAYVRSQVSESPTTRERRERRTRIIEEMA